MPNTAPETLSPQAFEGKGFPQIAKLISGIAIEKQQGKLVGLTGNDRLHRKLTEGTAGRLARALLGEEEVFHGDPIERLKFAAEQCGVAIGYAPEGSLEHDERIQKATAVTAAALAVGSRMGVMEQIYSAYQKGHDRGVRQQRIETTFVLPHIVKRDAVSDVIKAQTSEKPVSGMDIRTISEDQLFHGKEKSISLTNLASRMRMVYLNLSLRPDTKAAATKLVTALFATKGTKDVAFDAELGLGSAKAMMAHWDTELEAYITAPIEEWVSRPMLFEKVIRALHATGVYPKESADDIRKGWAGKTLEVSLKYLKRRKEVGETFHSPFRILRRLSDETIRRIEKGGVSDLTFAQGLIGAIEKLYEPQELASYQDRLVAYKDDQLVLISLKAALSLKQLETRATGGEVSDAMQPGPIKESGDFQTRINTYTLERLASSIAWRSERAEQSKKAGESTKELEAEIGILISRRSNLLRLRNKDDLIGIQMSISARKTSMSRLGQTDTDQLKRSALEVELNALREARERRVLYFETKSPDALRGSIEGREQELKKVGLDLQSKERITAELDVLRKRQSDLRRLANKNILSDVEGSIKNRRMQLSSLGAGDLDALRKTKIEVELIQLKKARERLTVKK